MLAASAQDFDESELRPEGKAALDIFAKDLQGARFEMISVEGYTDRIGSEAYNRALSQRRANAVKAYLVTSGSKWLARAPGSDPRPRPGACGALQQATGLNICKGSPVAVSLTAAPNGPVSKDTRRHT